MKLLGDYTFINGAGGVMVRQGLQLSLIVIDIIITPALSSPIINTYIHTYTINKFVYSELYVATTSNASRSS